MPSRAHVLRFLLAGGLVALLLPVAGDARGDSPCRDTAFVPTLASPSDCRTAQPGAGVRIGDTYCTLNFLFRGSDRHTYAGTAGHCAYAVEVGAEAGMERQGLMGRVVYVEHDTRRRRDFALIRLAAGVPRNPRVEVLGGPRGTLRGSTTGPTDVQHIGRGVGLSQVKDARDAVLTATSDPELAYMLAAASSNDSGSPVLTVDHQAVGWVVSLDNKESFSSGAPSVSAGWLVIRVDPPIDRAARALGIRLSLMTAP